MGAKLPTPAAVAAAGRNYGALVMGASVKVQQRLYKSYLRYLSKYDVNELNALGRKWWEEKVMRGPGVDW